MRGRIRRRGELAGPWVSEGLGPYTLTPTPPLPHHWSPSGHVAQTGQGKLMWTLPERRDSAQHLPLECTPPPRPPDLPTSWDLSPVPQTRSLWAPAFLP